MDKFKQLYLKELRGEDITNDLNNMSELDQLGYMDYKESPEARNVQAVEQLNAKPANIQRTSSPSQSSAGRVYKMRNVKKAVANEKPLRIVSLISGNLVEIFGHVPTLTSNFSSDWNTQKYYGRLDPIAVYGGTSRTISLTMEVVRPERVIFDDKVITPGIADARDQYQVINQLVNFLYPAYDFDFKDRKTYNTGIIKASPLLAISYAGIIGGNVSTPAWGGGFLKVYATSFSFSFDAQSLWDEGVSTSTETIIYYKKATLNFEFGVLHDHNIGHDRSGIPLTNRVNQDDTLDTTSYAFPLQVPGGKKT